MSKTTIPRPLGARIIARAIEIETKTKGGIYLAEATAKNARPELADVLATGPEVEEVKKGDRIVYTKYGPDTIRHNGEELLVILEEDCLAVEK